MKPTEVFLNVTAVPHRRPAGADPFTYRETRPLRHRASWWTRGTSTELYRTKLVPTEDEAARLALRWLARENKGDVRWIDTTTRPERFGYSHVPASSAEKKSAAQLDAEIADALGKESRR